MTNPKFSVITPVYIYDNSRLTDFIRCQKSIENQTFANFEYIIVNDGSKINFTPYGKGRVVAQPHLERIRAYNMGLAEAKGEWIAFCDSDDEYVSYYLEAVNMMIEKYPDVKMFNFGSLHITPDFKVKPRDPFMPKKEKVGHEIFGGGNIVNGTFVFNRSIYENLGAFPETSSPWDFSGMAQEEFPELKTMFMVDHVNEPNKIVKELGNPWGNDMYLFYKYTRKYHSQPVNAHLYVVHPSRREHKL